MTYLSEYNRSVSPSEIDLYLLIAALIKLIGILDAEAVTVDIGDENASVFKSSEVGVGVVEHECDISRACHGIKVKVAELILYGVDLCNLGGEISAGELVVEESNGFLIKIGNVVFASFPYEVFAEIGLRIDAEFKKAAILSLSNSNGSQGYFLTQEATVRAGYERDVFRYRNLQSYVDNADWHMMTQTVEHIKEL